MLKEKKIRVLIEIPEKWFDADSPLGFASYSMKQMVENQLKEALTEEYIKKVTLPKIKFSKEEIKDRILTLLAERAMQSNL